MSEKEQWVKVIGLCVSIQNQAVERLEELATFEPPELADLKPELLKRARFRLFEFPRTIQKPPF